MLYTIETIAGKEYKLRLGAQNIADIEKRLGKSVLDVLLQMAPEGMDANTSTENIGIKGMSTPRVGEICVILHGAMQKFQHGVTLEQVYDLYDEHIDNDGSYMDFFGIFQKVLEVSGFLPKKAEAETQAAEVPAPSEI